jgi:hypothetical protein
MSGVTLVGRKHWVLETVKVQGVTLTHSGLLPTVTRATTPSLNVLQRRRTGTATPDHQQRHTRPFGYSDSNLGLVLLLPLPSSWSSERQLI